MTDQHRDDELFSDASDGNQSDPVSSSHTISDDGNPLESLVGEGKKFKTIEDLARGKMESDKFIAQMQREQQELREELNKRLTVEEVLAKIEERQKASKSAASEDDDTESYTPEGNRGVDLSAIEKLVESKFNEAQSMADQRRNMQSVKNIMKDRFGSNYIRVMEEKLEELGVGKDWANGLAATQPKAFLGLMGTPSKPSGDVTSPPQTQVRSTTSTGHRTFADFEKLRKEDPVRYFSKDVQMEMHRLALANPDEFLS